MRVVKEGGDYKFEGEVVARFKKRNGTMERVVVEDDRGLLFIFNPNQLRTVVGPEPDDVAWSNLEDTAEQLSSFISATDRPEKEPALQENIDLLQKAILRVQTPFGPHYRGYPKACGKCGASVLLPGPCPSCNDQPFGAP